MWERIVLNLLSNALKFTFEGKVTVRQRVEGSEAVLTVSDTGTGIPEDELPRLFERFHRVLGARARTNEGSGIGLALVSDLVRLHGGRISARSQLDEGSELEVRVPLGFRHLEADRVEHGVSGTEVCQADAYVEEAMRWLPTDAPAFVPADRAAPSCPASCSPTTTPTCATTWSVSSTAGSRSPRSGRAPRRSPPCARSGPISC
jgi:hypothetical protein